MFRVAGAVGVGLRRDEFAREIAFLSGGERER